jgi:opacity protein-like surface antigen
MKRILLIVIIVTGLVSFAWGQNALDFSIGGGGYISNDFGGGFESRISFLGQSITATLPMPYFGGGGYVFFDATYLETSFGMFFGGGEWEIATSSPLNQTQRIGKFEFQGLHIGLLGKYPFAINPKAKLFPLLGFDYTIVLTAKLEGQEVDNPKDWNHFIFKFGGGSDFFITDSLFIRLEALYGIRLTTKAEQDYADDIKTMLLYLINQYAGFTPNVTSETLLGHGFTAKLALGYKF